MSSPSRRSPGDLAPLALILAVAALQLAAAAIGAFRSDDWINLERGHWALTPAGFRGIWTGLNPFTLYRPLVDLWHGAMLRLFGLHAPPMLAALVAIFGVQSALMARLARERGADRRTAWLVAAAVWVPVNTYVWTTLWVSNVTGSLLALTALVALIQHHRAVRHARTGRPHAQATLLGLLAYAAGTLCKEEAVLLPAALLALEMVRWPRLGRAERGAAITSWLGFVAITLAFVILRTQVLPTPQDTETRYHLKFGLHIVRNFGFLAVNALALPLGALALARLAWPAAFRRETWTGAAASLTRREVAAALAWSLSAMLLYLPIAGRPAWGYLYLPGLATAYGTGWLLAHAERAAAPRRLGAVGLLAVLVTISGAGMAYGMAQAQWHRYAGITREAWAVLDRELAPLPPNARLVFLDDNRGETIAHRSVFNLIFDNGTGSMLRLRYGRDDIRGLTMYGPERISLAQLPDSVTALYHTEHGRIHRMLNPAAPAADDKGGPGTPK